MQQATVNLFADMGVQPATLMSGLTAATASTDTTAPTSTITSPAQGANLSNGSAVTISGTATDVGGVVAGVEVSTDGASQRSNRAFALFDLLEAQSPLDPDTRNDLVMAHLELAYNHGKQGKRAKDEASIRRAVRLAERLVREFPDDPRHGDQLVSANNAAGSALSPGRGGADPPPQPDPDEAGPAPGSGPQRAE